MTNINPQVLFTLYIHHNIYLYVCAGNSVGSVSPESSENTDWCPGVEPGLCSAVATGAYPAGDPPSSAAGGCFLFLLLATSNRLIRPISARPPTPTPTPMPILAPSDRPPSLVGSFVGVDDTDDVSEVTAAVDEAAVLPVARSVDWKFSWNMGAYMVIVRVPTPVRGFLSEFVVVTVTTSGNVFAVIAPWALPEQ